MKFEDAVEVALVETAGADGDFTSRCVLAKTVYDFLMSVKQSEGCPWYAPPLAE